MTHTPPILRLSGAALDQFLDLLPEDRVTRAGDRITVHADVGDATWFVRDGTWLTAAPAFDTARRFGASGTVH